MKRPLLWLALAAIIGVIAARITTFYWALLLVVVSFIIVFIIISNTKKKHFFSQFQYYKHILFFLPIIMFLFILRSLQTSTYPLDNVFDISTQAIVNGLVETKTYKNEKVSAVIHVVSISVGDVIETKPTRIMAYLPEGVDPEIGEYIIARGDLAKLKKPTNDGQFNEETYYKGKGIWYKLYVTDSTSLFEKELNIKKVLMNFKNKLSYNVDQMYTQSSSGLMKEMLLGEKNQIDEETKDLYVENGIAHLLSISGMHFSLIGYAIYQLFQRLGVPIKSNTFLSTGLLILYSILIGFGISSVRALLMFSILLFANVINRTYDTLSAISLSAMIILLINPHQLYSTSFVLSYGAVLAIVLIPPQLFLICHIKNKLLKTILTSLSVTIGMLPIQAYLFYEIPLYSTILNLLVIPLMSILMPAMILSLVIYPISPILSLPLVFIAEKIFLVYELLCRFFGNLPMSRIIVGKPSLVAVFIYYGILFLILYKEKWLKRKVAIILGVLVLQCFVSLREYKILDITFIDVGQGLSVFIKKGNNTYLYDGGGKFNTDLGEYVLLPFLKSRGVSKLDYVFVSHGDMDHIKGISELIGKYEIHTIILGRLEKQPDSVVKLIESANQENIKIVYFKKGDTVQDNDFIVRCLYPYNNQKVINNNEGSITLEVIFQDFDMLLCGDILKKQESLLMDTLEQYDVVQIPHHGSKTSSSEEFVRKVDADYGIISAGRNNRFGHPNQVTLDTYEDNDTVIYNTITHGQIRVSVDGDGKVKVMTMVQK